MMRVGRHFTTRLPDREEAAFPSVRLADVVRSSDKDDAVTPLTPQGILTIAPPKVSALIEAIPALADRIVTIDRFQGQEAPVVIRRP